MDSAQSASPSCSNVSDSAQSASPSCSNVGVLIELGVPPTRYLDINQCRVELIAERGRKNAMLDTSKVKEKDEEQEKAIKVLRAMEEKMNQLLAIHQEQVDSLRDEISQKHDLITNLKETNKKYKLELEKMQKDFEKFEKEKSQKSQEMTETKQEEAGEEKDFCALRGAVTKELQTLHILRKLFVQDLQACMKRSENPDENEDDDSCLAQKQNKRLPEDDLDKFTKVHRMIMRESAELRCEVAQLSGIAQAKLDRIKVLETALMDAEKRCFIDKQRLSCLLDRIKSDSVRSKNFPCVGNMSSGTKLKTMADGST